MKIIGNKVIVREFSSSDIEDFYEFSSDQKVGYYAGWKPHTDIRLSERILFSKIMTQGNYAICLKDSDKVIGSIELNKSHIRENLNAFEIGFALNPKYWGNGYVFEASRLIMQFAFMKLKADVVEICHIEDNIKSEKTVRSLGFIYEGTIRQYKKLYDGRVVDVKLYRLLNTEYERIIRNERIKD